MWFCFFFFKQKTAYEMRISDWSSDVCSSDLDRPQLQRGFQVFKEVCSACHSLRLVAFRDLEGLGYSEAEVKAIAANWSIETPSVDPEIGEASTRQPIPADPIPLPFANDVAERAATTNAIHTVWSLLTPTRHSVKTHNKTF